MRRDATESRGHWAGVACRLSGGNEGVGKGITTSTYGLGIGTARVVICGLTGKNANVFYEAGIAHTMGQDVILIAQHESDIPFDLRHIRHIRYLANDQGLKELAEKVSSRLEALVNR